MSKSLFSTVTVSVATASVVEPVVAELVVAELVEASKPPALDFSHIAFSAYFDKPSDRREHS